MAEKQEKPVVKGLSDEELLAIADALTALWRIKAWEDRVRAFRYLRDRLRMPFAETR